MIVTATTSNPDERIRSTLVRDLPVVCFANDWAGPPTSKHHIMRVYAQHTDVLWIEATGMRRPNLLRRHDLARSVGRVGRAFRRRHDSSPAEARLHVRSPLQVPLPGNPVAGWLNGILLRRVVRAAAERLRWTSPPVLWVYTPTVGGHLDGIPHRAVVYHCVYRWWAFSEYDRSLMHSLHVNLCRTADVVFTSSQALTEDCQAYRERVFQVPHGVDWAHFARAASDPPARPRDIADLDGPVLGFIGLIHDWVDLALLRSVAQRFPHATLVLVGPARVPLTGLSDLPNVRILGARPYHDLPAYCASFDVALVPFLVNELTVAVNPIKVREYLSAGVPTVSTALPELVALDAGGALQVAHSREAFLHAIEGVLAQGRDGNSRRQLSMSLKTEAWPERCAEMAEVFARELA